MTDRYRVKEGVFVRDFDGELVILDMNGGDYFGINDVGARYWSALAEGLGVKDAVDACAAEFEVDRVTLEADLAELTRVLVDKGLLVGKS